MAQDNPYPAGYSQGLHLFKRAHWAMHTAWGYPGNMLQNVIETTGAYTHHKKKISNAAAAAVLASTNGSTAVQNITTSITQPDVPRVLSITIGGSGFSNDKIVITGYNVEGKQITDSLSYTGTGLVNGTLVFEVVSQITLPSTLGASATVTVGTTTKIGLRHRGVPNYTTIVAVYDTALDAGGPYPTANRPQVDAAVSSSNLDNEFVEKNWVTPAHGFDGTTFYYFFYWFYKVLVYPPKDSPEFQSTTTSTSTSSTSSSTSTSSTSTSISSTSTSASSTSTSFSSTSTSTTTLPV
jgi:hypothetical protein